MLKFFLIVSVLCFVLHGRVIYYKGNILPVPYNAKLRYVVVNPPEDFDPVYFEDAPDIETTTSTEADIKREICDESATNFENCTETTLQNHNSTEDTVTTISPDITTTVISFTESTTPVIEEKCLYDCSDKCVLWDNRCQDNTDCPLCYECSTEEFSVYKVCKHVSKKNTTLSSTNGDFLFNGTTVEKITSTFTSPAVTTTTFKHVDTTVSSTTFEEGSGSGDDQVPNDNEKDDDDEDDSRDNAATNNFFLSSTTPTRFKKIETTISPLTDLVSKFNEISITTKRIEEDEHFLTSTVKSFPSTTFDTRSGSGDDDKYTEGNNTASTDLFPSNTNITTSAFENLIETTFSSLTDPVSTFNEIKTTTEKIDDHIFLTSTVPSMTIDTGSGSGDGKISDDDEGGDDDDDEFRGNTETNNTESTDLIPRSTNITTSVVGNLIETTLTPLTDPVSTFNDIKTTKKMDDHILLTSTVPSMTIDTGSGSGDDKISDDVEGGDDDDDEFRGNTERNNTESTDLIPRSTNITTSAAENLIETTLTSLTDPVSTFDEIKTTTEKIDDHTFLASTVPSITIDTENGSGDDDDDSESRENTERNKTASTDLIPSSTNTTTTETLLKSTEPVLPFNEINTTRKLDEDQMFYTSTIKSFPSTTTSSRSFETGSGDGQVLEDNEEGDDDNGIETTMKIDQNEDQQLTTSKQNSSNTSNVTTSTFEITLSPKIELEIENTTLGRPCSENQCHTEGVGTKLPCSNISYDREVVKVTLDGVVLVITHNNVSNLFPNTTMKDIWEQCHQVEKRCLQEDCNTQEVVTKQYPCWMISTNSHTGRMTIDGVVVTPKNITRLLPNARFENVWTQCSRPRTPPKTNYPCYMFFFDEQTGRVTLDGVVVTPNNFTELIPNGSYIEMVNECYKHQRTKVVPLPTTPKTPLKANYPCYMILFDQRRDRVSLDGVVITPNNFTKFIPNGSFEEMLKECYNYTPNKVCDGYECEPTTTHKSTGNDGNGSGGHSGGRGGGKNGGGGGEGDEDYQYKDDDDNGNNGGDAGLKNFDDFIFLEKEINFK